MKTMLRFTFAVFFKIKIEFTRMATKRKVRKNGKYGIPSIHMKGNLKPYSVLSRFPK